MIIRIETVGPVPGTKGATIRCPLDALVRITESQDPVPASSLRSGQHYCFFKDGSHVAEIAHVVME